MVVVQSFLILQLPSVAFNEVISFMNPINQVCLSFASKRTKKMMYQKQKLNLEVVEKDRYSAYQIVCKNKNGLKLLKITINSIWQEDYYKSSWKIDDRLVPVHREKGILKTFWKDETEGYQKMTSFLCNIFKIQNYSISFFFRCNCFNYLKIVKHLQKLKSELKINIKKIKVSTLTDDKNIYIVRQLYILENFKDVPELSIDSFHMTYQHDDSQSDTNYCTIKHALWLTLKDMNLLMKCKEINLWSLKWTTEEVNQFLKQWMERTMMVNVSLTVGQVDFQVAVKDLPVTPTDIIVEINGREHNPTESFEIERNDGVKAYFYMWEGSFIMDTYQ